jgi:hypothetical protein
LSELRSHLFLLLCLAVAGCNSDNDPTIASPGDAEVSADVATDDTSTPTDSSADTAFRVDTTPNDTSSSDVRPDVGGVCNNLDATAAPEVTLTKKALPMPAETGGTLAVGQYYVTSDEYYPDNADAGVPTYKPYRRAAEITATQIRTSSIYGTQPAIDNNSNYQSGSEAVLLKLTPTCPSLGSPTEIAYSASATEFRTSFRGGDPGWHVVVYTKQ